MSGSESRANGGWDDETGGGDESEDNASQSRAGLIGPGLFPAGTDSGKALFEASSGSIFGFARGILPLDAATLLLGAPGAFGAAGGGDAGTRAAAPLAGGDAAGPTAGGAAARAVQSLTRIVDVTPAGDSGEAQQNAEPSLAVNPIDPSQIVVGAFGPFNTAGSVNTPYFLSGNGGATWSDYGVLPTVDKSLAWTADGSEFLTATLTLRQSTFSDIATYAGTVASGGFSGVNTFAPRARDDLDQPWVRTGPSNHVYVAYNNLNNAGVAAGQGMTASVNVSSDGGASFIPVVIEHVTPVSGQDASAVRVAVAGNTVYGAFTRWNATVEDDANGTRYASQIVVVRSDNAGADGFAALGPGGAGTVVATPTGVVSTNTNTSLTLGQERTDSDMAIAVDPSNPSHVVIAYSNAPGSNGSGQLQLAVAESTDAGASWSSKFATSAATRSAQPALAILADGTIGLLYDNYDPATDRLSQHLLQTADDFATVDDTQLANESNGFPVATADPYLGDFFDLESVGNTFYGVFSASNADNGSNANFGNVAFQRNFTGTPGAADFRLTDSAGRAVPFSIDPFFFVTTEDQPNAPPVIAAPAAVSVRQGQPAPVSGISIGDSDAVGAGETITVTLSDGNGLLFATNGGGGTVAGSGTTTLTIVGFLGEVNADLATLADQDGIAAADTIAVNANDGRGGSAPPQAIAVTVSPGGAPPRAPASSGAGDFNRDGKADVLWRNDNGDVGMWLSNPGAGVSFTFNDFGVIDPSWHIQAAADFNADGKSDVLWRNDNGDVGLWASNPGAGVSFTFADLGVVDRSWHIDAAADLTGDGKSDVLWRNDNGDVGLWGSNTGAGVSFTFADLGVIGTGWHIQTAADVNADGKADVVWRNDNGDVGLWGSNPGAGVSFTFADLGVIDTGWHIQAAADFNADGKADILWRNDNGDVGLWNSNPGAGVSFTFADLGAVDTSWHIAAAGDFNADGKADVLWRNNNGDVGLWQSNPGGATSFTFTDLGVIDPAWHIGSTGPV